MTLRTELTSNIDKATVEESELNINFTNVTSLNHLTSTYRCEVQYLGHSEKNIVKLHLSKLLSIFFAINYNAATKMLLNFNCPIANPDVPISPVHLTDYLDSKVEENQYINITFNKKTKEFQSLHLILEKAVSTIVKLPLISLKELEEQIKIKNKNIKLTTKRTSIIEGI